MSHLSSAALSFASIFSAFRRSLLRSQCVQQTNASTRHRILRSPTTHFPFLSSSPLSVRAIKLCDRVKSAVSCVLFSSSPSLSSFHPNSSFRSQSSIPFCSSVVLSKEMFPPKDDFKSASKQNQIRRCIGIRCVVVPVRNSLRMPFATSRYVGRLLRSVSPCAACVVCEFWSGVFRCVSLCPSVALAKFQRSFLSSLLHFACGWLEFMVDRKVTVCVMLFFWTV